MLENGLNNLKRNKIMEIFASCIIAIPLWVIASELRELNRFKKK